MAYPLITPAALDRIVRLGPLLLLGGIAYIAAGGFGLVSGAGTLTAALAALLGTEVMSCARWRREPGVWMLAALSGATFGALLGVMAMSSVIDLARGTLVLGSAAPVIRFAATAIVLAFALWVSVSIAVWNRRSTT